MGNGGHTLVSSFFGGAALGCGGGGLYVPKGLDANPKNASTSPFVSMPRIPVPLIPSGLETSCSANSR